MSDRLKRDIRAASETVREGGVIGYPTETVYGLGCDARRSDAVERIYAMKGRGFASPMLVLIRDEERLSSVVEEIPDHARALMERFWPGPLTLVFQSAGDFESRILGDDGGLAVRISSDPVCRSLLECWDGPLVSTSANRTGLPPAKSASELRAIFGDEVDVVVDDGSRLSMGASTLVDVRTHPPRVLREGAVPQEAIERVLGGIDG